MPAGAAALLGEQLRGKGSREECDNSCNADLVKEACRSVSVNVEVNANILLVVGGAGITVGIVIGWLAGRQAGRVIVKVPRDARRGVLD